MTGTEPDWTPTAREVPAEGVVVLTMTQSGQVQELKRQGRLWFLPDGKMYVYFVPAFWRAKA